MAAVASLPGLSQLVNWPTQHLTDAAEHWEAVAERNYGLANRVWQDASSIEWQGKAADALRTATHSDMTETSTAADQLHTAAQVARSGASDLYSARSRLLYAIEDAQNAGFDVDEEGSVLDRSTGGSAAQRAARQVEAEALATDIRQRAAHLVATDQRVAGKVNAAVAGIRDTFPHSPTVHAVDNHTFKQEPVPRDPNADTPWQERPPPKTLDEARDGLRQLQPGRNPPVRQVKTPEELKEFWDWLTKGAKDLPPRGDTTRKILEDGTEVDLRPNSSSGGPTIEVQTPGAKNPKVHLPLPTSEDPPPATSPAPSSSSDHSWLPDIGHDLAEGGKAVFGWVVVGGVLVWTLLSGGGQASGSAAP